MIGIYRIINLINGKVYIGQSINIEARFNQHRHSAFNPNSKSYNLPLYCDIRKYGLQYFEFDVVELCDRDNLSRLEYLYISKAVNCYNIQNSANYKYGIKVTESKILEIISYLEECQLSHRDIAIMTDVSIEVVDSINTGRGYKLPYVSYPIVNYKELSRLNRLCPCCNKFVLSKDAELCKNCFDKMRQYTIATTGGIKPSRDTLKSMIRKHPFTYVGEYYHVSDNAIRKWCDMYGLPKRRKDIDSYSDEVWETI